MFRARILLTVVAALLVAGCAAAPVPAGPSAAPPAPQRPRELRLDGVDPCALLTPSQRASLGLDGTPVAYQATAPLSEGPACSIRGFSPRYVSVGFALAMTTGLEEITAPGGVTDTVLPITVAGFPAVIARGTNQDGCIVDVDVAAGQVLDVLFRDGGALPPIPQDQLCRDAVEVAEHAVLTLLAS